MEDVNTKCCESTENWLVSRARSCLDNDPYASKAWLLTARTLFPKNFSIQFEAYGIAKAEKDLKEASRLLEEMFLDFPNENKLWLELQSITSAVQNSLDNSRVTDNEFLKEIFYKIPSGVQSQMLLKIAENNTDTIQHARLILLVLNTFPDLMQQHGLKLVDTLLFKEKHAHLSTPINCYRKYLVCDILPVILSYKSLDAPVKHIQKWLQKSIEFYISYITQPPASDAPTTPLKSPDLLSPSGKSFAAISFKKLGVISGLTERESVIASPWNSLFDLLKLFSAKLSWHIGDLYYMKSRESQWQHVRGLKTSSDVKEIVYTTSVLFLECLILYSSRVDSNQFAASGSGPGLHPSLVLIESCSTSAPTLSTAEPSAKRVKGEAGASVIASASVPGANVVIHNFTTAYKCWDMLHSTDTLEKEFTKLLHYWKSENWPWLRNFEIDCLLYQGQHRDVITKLQQVKQTNAHYSQLRVDLQLASSYYNTGSFSKACEMVLNVIESLPHVTEPNQSQESSNAATGRRLQLLACIESDILPYCIELVITCFKEKAFAPLVSDDMALGHMIVLLQYDWPKHENLFTKAVTKIRLKGSFTYSLFFTYVINIDMLEEFAWLKNPGGGAVSLDVLPVTSQAIIQQRTITRGLQKGVKEDFKVHMEKQVTRCEENVERLIRKFLTEEKEILKTNLS